jgi:hypothetical protein
VRANVIGACQWLFGTPDGHLALLFTMMAGCGVATCFHVEHAYQATVTLGATVLLKLKS